MIKAIVTICLILFPFVTFAQAEDTEEIVFFVQSAKGVEFDAGSRILILNDLSPAAAPAGIFSDP